MPKLSNKKSFKPLIIGLIIVITLVFLLYLYYNHTQVYPSTDNAYVNANLVNVAPKVNGYIAKIYVKNNQLVHKGDPLIDIDPKDYSISVEQAQQNYLLATEQALEIKTKIKAANTDIIKAAANYKFAKEMAERYTLLYTESAAAKQDMQKYVNQAIEARSALALSHASLDQANASYKAAMSQVNIAKINLEDKENTNSYTRLTSPIDGYVSDLNLQTGELVNSGQKLFGLVDDKTWWIDANFKETQLKHIRPGQGSEIELDMYNHKYSGVVQSISYASGNTFSLLPAENATGNWVKVTQRFTVRIALKNDPNYPLRVGSSAEVTVDTTKN